MNSVAQLHPDCQRGIHDNPAQLVYLQRAQVPDITAV